MASTNKTGLGLNQWVADDQPKMADFNKDNEIIDSKIKELTFSLEIDKNSGVVTIKNINNEDLRTVEGLGLETIKATINNIVKENAKKYGFNQGVEIFDIDGNAVVGFQYYKNLFNENIKTNILNIPTKILRTQIFINENNELYYRIQKDKKWQNYQKVETVESIKSKKTTLDELITGLTLETATSQDKIIFNNELVTVLKSLFGTDKLYNFSSGMNAKTGDIIVFKSGTDIKYYKMKIPVNKLTAFNENNSEQLKIGVGSGSGVDINFLKEKLLLGA